MGVMTSTAGPDPRAAGVISDPDGRPRRSLGVPDAIAVLAVLVIGARIFKTPFLIASHVPSATVFLFAWVLGGLVSLIGALCYAELATTYPDAGGDYHFLSRAYGGRVAFMFAWARLAVIQTGSIALHAFLIGDYVRDAAGLGPAWSAILAAVTVIALTAVNVAGLRPGKWAQNVLSVCVVLGLLLVIAVGAAAAARGSATPVQTTVTAGAGG